MRALLAGHAFEPREGVLGIETDRGLWVRALLEAGCEVYASLSAAPMDRPSTSSEGC